MTILCLALAQTVHIILLQTEYKILPKVVIVTLVYKYVLLDGQLHLHFVVPTVWKLKGCSIAV